MKEGIHPPYYVVNAKCACGNTFTTRSTRKEISLDICSGCHPFFTGKQKFVDTEGRIDKFLKKFEKSKARQAEEKTTRKKPVAASRPKAKGQGPARIETSTGVKKAKTLTSRAKS